MISVCVCVTKDLNNYLTDMVLLYRITSHRSQKKSPPQKKPLVLYIKYVVSCICVCTLRSRKWLRGATPYSEKLPSKNNFKF